MVQHFCSSAGSQPWSAASRQKPQSLESCGCSPLISIQQPRYRLPPEKEVKFGLLKAEVYRKRAGEKKCRKKHMIHRIQETFSHSTSCITHEVLTEPCTHSPFPLAVSSWQLAQARVDKLFWPFSLSDALFHSLVSAGSGGKRLHLMERRQGYSQAGPPCWFHWWSWMPAVLQQCLTVGPVFRQSDRSQPEHPKNPGTLAPRIHHPANIYILLSTCLFLRSWLGLCLFILPSLESLSWVLPLFHSPSPPSTQLALILSCFSLCLSPLSFWDSIRALEEGERKRGV